MHIQNVNINLGKSGQLGAAFLAALFAGGLPEPAAAPAPAPATGIMAPPRIGESWKGQGGIYVGVGRGYDCMPDHRLILPTDPKAIFKKRALGTYGVDVTGATSDHNVAEFSQPLPELQIDFFECHGTTSTPLNSSIAIATAEIGSSLRLRIPPLFFAPNNPTNGICAVNSVTFE